MIFLFTHQLQTYIPLFTIKSFTLKSSSAFTKLKEIFITEPVLVAPDLDKKMRVKADTSDYAMGEVLLVKGEDKR